ncbi:hypothetical protein LCGC14_3103470, partial [marine sediment metagenome]
HSNDALRPLPDKAIWVAMESKVYQGKLDINALRVITGKVEATLAIFTEDLFSKSWIESILRTDSSIKRETIEVHHMEGDGTAVKINRHHNRDPTRRFESICFIDGDSQQKDSPDDHVYRLPGEGPESYVYSQILDVLETTKGVLSVSLQHPYIQADSISDIVRQTHMTNRDEHVLQRVTVQNDDIRESP